TGFWLHLLEMQKTFVAINTELSWIPELLYAFDIQGKPFNLTILSEKHISIVNEVWPKNLFQVSYVGIQGHLSDPMGFSDKQAHPLEAIRLGQIHKNIEQAEPVLRNADLAFIDLNILKSSEIPGIENVGSSGLSSEQLSQLCRYLGFSEKLKAIAFYGIPETDHLSPQVADICAQALWYFYQGTTARRLDYPIRKEHLIEYLVESSNNNPTVKFFKSDLSDRWWFKIPGQLPRDFATHGLYPCSFEEYEQTCFGEIPDRLISAMHRYDQLRKE
ncbi:MAG: hypothetical protein ABIV51_08730, partial [Saprospiraceae bacterium]